MTESMRGEIMKTILALAGILAVGGLFWHLKQEDAEIEARRAQQSIEQTQQAPVPAFTPAVFVPSTVRPQRLADLYLVRGMIERVTADGVIVQCEELQKIPAAASLVTANSGNAEVAMAARLASGEFDNRFGHLLQLKNGLWAEADMKPTRKAMGLVLLIGAPTQTVGDRFQVVAANTGDLYGGRLAVYTSKFPATAEVSDAWMWNKHGNPLDRSRRGY